MEQASRGFIIPLLKLVYDNSPEAVEKLLETESISSWSAVCLEELRISVLRDHFLYLRNEFRALDSYEVRSISVFHLAALAGRAEILTLILDRGVKVESTLGKFRVTALHLASFGGHKDAMRLLVETYGSKVDRQDVYGRTALHYACIGGKLEAVKLLCEELQCDAKIKNEIGETALDMAKRCGYQGIGRYLTDNFFDSPAIYESVTTSKELTPSANVEPRRPMQKPALPPLQTKAPVAKALPALQKRRPPPPPRKDAPVKVSERKEVAPTVHSRGPGLAGDFDYPTETDQNASASSESTSPISSKGYCKSLVQNGNDNVCPDDLFYHAERTQQFAVNQPKDLHSAPVTPVCEPSYEDMSSPSPQPRSFVRLAAASFDSCYRNEANELKPPGLPVLCSSIPPVQSESLYKNSGDYNNTSGDFQKTDEAYENSGLFNAGFNRPLPLRTPPKPWKSLNNDEDADSYVNASTLIHPASRYSDDSPYDDVVHIPTANVPAPQRTIVASGASNHAPMVNGAPRLEPRRNAVPPPPIISGLKPTLSVSPIVRVAKKNYIDVSAQVVVPQSKEAKKEQGLFGRKSKDTGSEQDKSKATPRKRWWNRSKN